MEFKEYPKLNEYCFENFERDEDWQEAIYIKAKEYAENYKGKWFYISGQVFSGKTHICVSILKEMRNKEKVSYEYMPFISDRELLKYYEYIKFVNTLKAVDVLIIDDFCRYSSIVSDKYIAKMFDIITFRYYNNKPCIFASNQPLEEISKINKKLGAMIYKKAKKFILYIGEDFEKNYVLKKISSTDIINL